MNAVRFGLAIGVILCGCHESNRQADSHTGNGWTRVALNPMDDRAAVDAWGMCMPSFDKSVAAVLEERLAMKAEMETLGWLTLGLTTSLKLIDHTVLRGSDDTSPIVILAVYEDNAAHVYQHNLVLVGVVKGNELLFQETLEGSDDYSRNDDGIVLWSGRTSTEYRLFVGTTGPTFQGWASLGGEAWSIRPSHGSKKLFLVSSWETDNHTVEFHFTPKGNGMAGYVRLGNPSLDGKSVEISGEDKAEEVTATVIDPVTIAVEISN